MANGDNLRDVLALARREMPDVDAAVWERFALLVSLAFGASRIYVPAAPKRRLLEELAAAGEARDAQDLAAKLGVSVRRVQQLRRLR